MNSIRFILFNALLITIFTTARTVDIANTRQKIKALNDHCIALQDIIKESESLSKEEAAQVVPRKLHNYYISRAQQYNLTFTLFEAEKQRLKYAMQEKLNIPERASLKLKIKYIDKKKQLLIIRSQKLLLLMREFEQNN